jgi:hypothetical protein
MPADTDALARFPSGNSRADRIDETYDFVTGHAWILQPRPQSIPREQVAVADATRLDFDANRSCWRIGDGAFDDFEGTTGTRDLHDAHLGHDLSNAGSGPP